MDQEQILYMLACLLIIMVACYLSLSPPIVEGLNATPEVITPTHPLISDKLLIKYLTQPVDVGGDRIQFTPLVPMVSLNIATFNPANKSELWIYNGSNISSGDKIILKISEFPEYQKGYFAKIILTLAKESLTTTVKITKPTVKPATNQPPNVVKSPVKTTTPSIKKPFTSSKIEPPTEMDTMGEELVPIRYQQPNIQIEMTDEEPIAPQPVTARQPKRAPIQDILNEVSFGGFFTIGDRKMGLQCKCQPMKN